MVYTSVERRHGQGRGLKVEEKNEDERLVRVDCDAEPGVR